MALLLCCLLALLITALICAFSEALRDYRRRKVILKRIRDSGKTIKIQEATNARPRD